MVVIIVAKAKISIRSEIEQAFDRLQIFDGAHAQLLLQPPHQQDRRAHAVEHQKGGEHEDVPHRQPRTNVFGPVAHQSASSRTINPTPRTVWTSFLSKRSSTFRRSRATCTSITLSSGVCRTSFQRSLANISRETTRPW